MAKDKLQISRDRQANLIDAMTVSFRRDIIKEKNRYIRLCADAWKKHNDIPERLDDIHTAQMRKIFEKAYAKVIRAFGLETERIAIKSHGVYLEKKAEAWEYFLRQWITEWGAEMVKKTSQTTRNDVRKALFAALDSGQGVNERSVIKAILAVTGLSPWRSNTIARTEMHKAAMFSSKKTAQKIQTDTGLVLKKRWVPVEDSRTREDHAEMIGSEAIGMEEKFLVGGEKMDRPHDPSASARNVINCRCVLVYESEGGF